MKNKRKTIAIEAHNIGKKYNVELRKRSHTLRGDLTHVFSNNEKSYKWALKNVSFTIHTGEVFGIIGPNGAGKSTLLKIISRITPPTEGTISICGKSCSILDIGTGFHPELTGRENILLNSAILGMSPASLKGKITPIIAFAGKEVENYIDMPLKRYSSGMAIRLAFSIAAHLDSDILILDEIITVGDKEFSQQSYQKIKEITGKNRRTVLLVSHDLKKIEELCDQVMVLVKGEVLDILPPKQAVNQYKHLFKVKS